MKRTLNGLKLGGISVKKITNSREAFEFLKKVYVNRIIRSTERNDSSSRSHVVIDLECELDKGKDVTLSKLRFVDLAGSERYPKQSKISKVRLKEMTEINLSLSSMGRLVNGVNNGYDINHLMRSSLLTQILFKDLDFKMMFVGNLSCER